MNSNVRMILAVVLSASVFMLYMLYQSKNMPKPSEVPQATESSNTVGENTVAVNTASMQKVIVPEIDVPNFKGEYYTIEDNVVKATFSNGALISYILKEYHETTERNATITNKVEMVEQVYNNIYPFTVTFQTLSNSMVNDNNVFYDLVSSSDKSVVFSGKVVIDEQPVKITKTFEITDSDYQLKNKIEIENMGDKEVPIYYSYFLGTGIGPYRKKTEVTREDTTKASYLKEGKNTASRLLDAVVGKSSFFGSFFGGGNKSDTMQYKSFSGPVKWVSLNNRYFAIISSAPKTDVLFETATFTRPETNGYYNNFQMADLVTKHNIESKKSVTDEYITYMGPKSRTLFSKQYKSENYEGIFQESFLGLNLRPLTYVLDVILNKLYLFTRSYAIAIILFTFLFKVITFPLTQASYKSMKKMQLVNPKIERIKEQYKDSPEKLNAEIMNLYKKEKINPLGGCLPMLLPFPLLIAFFYLMQSMVELRNAPFLWITDLSSPDKLFIFPAALPILGGVNFNLLPIIMAVTSYLTMKLQPSSSSAGSAGKQMKMMTTIFPLMMLFMFYNFASGLALYWTAQNVFGLLQQYITSYIDKRKGTVTEILKSEEISAKKKKKHK